MPLPLLAASAMFFPLPAPQEAAPARSAGEVAYRSMPAQPEGDSERGRAGVESTAIGLASWLRAVPATAASDDPCPADRLAVSWSAPTWTQGVGAYTGPLGPVPTETTTAVNGFVYCEGSEYALMGFQARWDGSSWDLVHTPSVDEAEVHAPTAPEPTTPAPAPVVTIAGRTFGAAIEGLAAYEPQRGCDGTAKPGMLALRNLLLKDNPGSRNLGIVRGCSVGGQSEHKEGRAFDWGVNVRNATEKAQADAFVARLLATDEHGNRYALARRMGIMYVIWNQKIWSAYRADVGWRPYNGASPHTDHVHVSMSWAGANARTSFWSGNVVEVLLAAGPSGGGGGGVRPAASVRTSTPAPRARTATTVHRDRANDDAARAALRAEWDRQAQVRREATTLSWRERRTAEEQAEAEADAARWAAERLAREDARRTRSTTTSTTWAPRTTSTTVPRWTTSTTVPRSTTSTAPRVTTTTLPRATTTTVPRVTTTTAPRPTTTTTVPAATGGRRRRSTITTAPAPTTTAPAPTTTAAPPTTAAPTTTAPE